MINWFYDCYTILNKVYSDKAYLKQALNDTVIEESNRSLTVKTCYGVLDNDLLLSYYLKEITNKSPKLVIRTILKISMYAIKFLQKKPYAVTKNAVELTKKLGKGGASGFVNAFLRKFIDCDFVLPKEPIEKLSVEYSYPLFAVKELVNDYGFDNAVNILSAPHPKTCLSFYNTDGEEYLNSLGIEYEKTPFNNVFLCDSFVRNADYDLGVYTYQALGSVAICSVVEDTENLLDCCSAPGGKSVRLSYRCKNVTAWDIHEHRVDLIKDYAKRMKIKNINYSQMDSRVFHAEFADKFSAVLCDSPCSGLGVANENPDVKLNKTEQNVDELVSEQKSILNNVCKYVNIGGYLYYSTCSLLQKENSRVVKWFLENNKNFVLEKTTCPLDHIDTGYGLQFLPNLSGGNGFFVAKLKRIG